ncbi:hypothetical protein QZH41_013134 [Actinostola sp. cb2023]|nr:hypothetical protein QZH41_013134 [Actinostola sp. cb2023]
MFNFLTDYETSKHHLTTSKGSPPRMSMLPVLNVIVVAAMVLPVLSKHPLYIGGLFPMSAVHHNGWTGGNGIQPAAEIALNDVNSSGILQDYELKMLWNDTRISYASTSPKLSNKMLFPYFYRTIPDDTSFNAPRIAILNTYNWSSVAIIYQDEDIHRAAVEHLQGEMKKTGIHQLAAEGFRHSAVTQMSNLKKKDARIIIGNFFGYGARRVFCEAFKLDLYGPRYLWILLGYIENKWWTVKDEGVDCTADQMLGAANYHLSTDYLWQASDNLKIASGKTVKQFFEDYYHKVPQNLRDVHSSYAYDAIWAMALAINRTLTRIPGRRLDLLAYGDNETVSFLMEELDRTSFIGITPGTSDRQTLASQSVSQSVFNESGPVAFTDKRNRVGNTRILQFIDGNYSQVGLYINQLSRINWTGYDSIVWQGNSPPSDRMQLIACIISIGNSPPSDRMQKVYKLVPISLALYIFMIVVSSLCIIVAILFLWFNTKHRNIRLIKMSSPNLNNVIILGCIINYISVITFGLDGGLVDHGYDVICSSLVDVTYLTVWQVLDPMRRTLYNSKTETMNLDVEMIYQIEYCESAEMYQWLGILFGYKGLLLLFGAFLAWETRKVTITALNDSK